MRFPAVTALAVAAVLATGLNPLSAPPTEVGDVALGLRSAPTTVTVPELHGLDLDEAIQTLCRAGLGIYPLVNSETTGPELIDKVVRQIPPADATANRGALVAITLGHKPTLPPRRAGAR
jgi:beta-lactam-binding protein with PASTA domain